VTKICDKYPFLKQTPKEIRAFAVKEYLTNLKNSNDQYESKLKKNEYYKQTYLNYKSKKIKKPEMKFKKKKDQQSITINKDSIKIKKWTNEDLSK